MGNLQDNQPRQDRTIESNSNRSPPGTIQATYRTLEEQAADVIIMHATETDSTSSLN